jgi:NitT/TauT family transport system permease protein
MGFSYARSIEQRLYSAFIVPVIFIIGSVFILQIFSAFSVPVSHTVSFPYLFKALGATFLRLAVAYSLALVVAMPLALMVSYNAKVERILLPLFDISQSVPVLAFFPVIIAFFIKFHFFNGAAIFILFVTMVWSIMFNVIGGLKVIPSDILAASKVFGLSEYQHVTKIMLPGVLPYIVTGSLLAFAQGWNIVIVAEVLHTYIPGGTASSDLFGIGSMLVNAITTGHNDIFLASILVMVLGIAFLNFFVWQKLLHYAEKYKFD